MPKAPIERKKKIGNLPIGHPPFSTLQEFLTAERVEYAKGNPERVAIVRAISAKLLRDPSFMSTVEAMLGEPNDEPDEGDLELGRLIERSSFGWTPEPDLPSPKAAAAAVGAAVAVVAAGPAAAVAAV
jgi:hypothetical protein